MGDIKRQPNPQSVHNVHRHTCPNCHRPYDCNCFSQPEQAQLVCTDCETGRYNPMIHGGTGERQEA